MRYFLFFIVAFQNQCVFDTYSTSLAYSKYSAGQELVASLLDSSALLWGQEWWSKYMKQCSFYDISLKPLTRIHGEGLINQNTFFFFFFLSNLYWLCYYSPNFSPLTPSTWYPPFPPTMPSLVHVHGWCI